MKKIILTLIVFFLIISAIIVYFLLRITLLNQELSRLTKVNKDNTQALEQNKKYINSLQTQMQGQLRKNVDDLREQQTANVTDTKKETGVYISAIETQFSPSKKTIAFWINGPTKALFDAADLGLTFSNMKEGPSCTPGDVFSNYPLITSKNDALNITGIANITTEKIAGGMINKRFASCTFEKKDLSQKVVISIDPTKTHIYSLGTSILDLEHSFKDITW
ncbi:MAG: hypothetical protein NTV98_02570 [Candidatus Roizmanbacteria bacterium]|nr:hypothetical protein [Candidatus Roizmanbacteria bacterium]